ncbi:MAG: NADP-dependent malic enzyme [Firmicutes bacterium]|nr:NADP-dependent malic enzyme [Bacillota bacterium]
MDIYERSLVYHRRLQGKIEIKSRAEVANELDLSLAYSPGVAEPCRRIAKERDLVYEFTNKGNMIAVVSDGSAVLGLGNIGADAALPVMEGKSVLFKMFAGVDAVPICLRSQDVDVIVETIKQLAPSFSGINLEDIGAPRCFQIEERLQNETEMLIFHDDQHGTAVVTLAGLINAGRVVGKELRKLRVLVNGIGAAGSSVVRLLHLYGVEHIGACGKDGLLYPGMPGLNPIQAEIAVLTNPHGRRGRLGEIIDDYDVFVGLSTADVLSKDMVHRMGPTPIVFALANPEPEIPFETAKSAGAKVAASGRSDYPNQVNNVLGFPGIFRGALDVRAKIINDEMKIAAAQAIAGLISSKELSEDYIIPKPFDKRVVPAVALAVAKTAIKTGVAGLELAADALAAKIHQAINSH